MPATTRLAARILRRRFPEESFENAIELRKRLKSRSERDFTDAQIAVSQKITRIFEPSARDVLDKIYAGYLLEIFAQMIRVNVDRFRDFRSGKALRLSVPRCTCALSKSRPARLGSGKSAFSNSAADNIFIIA